MSDIRIVGASAGTGKTHRLSSELTQAISGGLPGSAVVATTFTRKAAAELEQRIRQMLLSAGQLTAVAELSLGSVGTINAICARWLSEYAIESGLSPAVAVLSEEAEDLFFRGATSAIVAKQAIQVGEAAERFGYDGAGSMYQRNPDWREIVRRIAALARQNAMDPSQFANFAERSLEGMKAALAMDETIDFRDWQRRFAGALRSDIDKLEADKRANGELKEHSKDALYECKSLLGKIEGGLSISYKQYVRVATHALNSPQRKTGVLADARDLLDSLPATDQFQTDLALIVRSCFACAADCLVEYQKGKAEAGLMDFADQESMVLARLVANASDGSAAQSNLAQSLQRRIQKLMVDEFQDTNPIQLALFRALHQLSGDSTWVGDPKQSIYRFRGADPDLMNQALASATKEDPLSECRRSTPSLIRFFNALFCKVFDDEDARNIEVTAYRKDDVNKALGIWYLEGNNQSLQMQALARAIRDLLEQRPELRPCDLAVLCRTNNRAAIIASALEALGMRASAPQGALCDTREVQLCLAGLRLFVDSKDSLARAEIMRLHPDHPHHSHWIESLQQASASSNPFTQSFQELRGRAGDTSLSGVLEAIIDVLDLDRLVDGWALPHLRRQNMDRLLGLAVEYCELCRMQGKPWHIGGFLQFLDEKQPEQARGVGEDTIEVITYHGAKGLEWKVVILAELHESQSDRLPDALQVVGAEKFDSLDPLAGRWLRFWPRPFGDGKSYDFFNDLLDASEEMQSQSAAAAEEQKRLLYVGMTRARDTLIFSIGTKVTQKDGRKFEASWLDNLRAEPDNLLLAREPGEAIRIGSEDFDCFVDYYEATGRVHSGAGVGDPDPTNSEGDAEFMTGNQSSATEAVASTTFVSPAHDIAERNLVFETPASGRAAPHIQARISASALPEVQGQVSERVAAEFRMPDKPPRIVERVSLGDPIAVQSKIADELPGNAVHSFLALDLSLFEESEKTELAQQCLQRWGADPFLKSADLLEIARRLDIFLGDRYPDSTAFREWPVSYRSEGQLLQGALDLLIETDDGYTIVDHKTYGGDDAESKALYYSPQLHAYSRALAAATGRPIHARWIHMPLQGMMYSVEC